MNNSRNMTEGSAAGHIIRFTLPLLVGNLLQQTYNIVDTIVVGRFLGDNALAAVGATGSVTYLFYTLCIGLSIGAGVIVSQCFGSGDEKKLRMSLVNSAFVTAAFGIIVSIVSVIAAEPVLRLLNVPDYLIGESSAYMKIACGGTTAVAAYNWVNAMMRAVGDSKTPLIFLGATSILNVALDLLFVVLLNLGVSGVAWATVLSQGASAVSCILYCFGKGREITITAKDIKPDKGLMLRCIKTGLPIAVQNGLVSVSMTALQRVTNGFGEDVMAAYTVYMRIEQLVQQPFSSLNAAVSTFTGQNIGAGKSERAVKGLRSAIKFSTIFAFAVLVLFVLFGEWLTSCFVDGDNVIGIASRAIVITGCFYWSLGIIHTIRGFLNGVGDTEYAFVNGTAEVICRIGLSILLTSVSSIGFRGIWLTTCFTWLVTATISFI